MPTIYEKGEGGRRYLRGPPVQQRHVPPLRFRERSRVAVVHNAFSDLLKSLQPHPEIASLFGKIMDEVLTQNKDERHRRRVDLQKGLEYAEQMLTIAEDKFLQDEIKPDAYQRIQQRWGIERERIVADLDSVGRVEQDLRKKMEKCVSFLSRVDVLFWKSSANLRRRLVGLMFPENLRFENGSFQTTGMSPVLGFFIKQFNDLQQVVQKKPANRGELSHLVHPTGFEPVFSP
jgi:site-specific DNA recombinase